MRYGEQWQRVLRGILMHIYFFELFLIVWLLPFCHNLYANNIFV